MTALLILIYNILVLPTMWLGGVLLFPISKRIRRGWTLRLQSRRKILALPPLADSENSWIWLHVASVGEFLMAQPYVLESRRRNPQLRVLCTYASDSLSDWLVGHPSPFDATYLLPWDSRAICDRLLQAYRPKVLVLLRYDFWPNLVFRAKNSGASLLLMAARARPNLGFFKRSLLQIYFRVCDRVFVTDADSFKALQDQFGQLTQFRLAPQGPAPILEARRKEEEQSISAQPAVSSDQRIDLVMGSCYVHEIDSFFRAYDQLDEKLRKRLRVCFVPHRPDEKILSLLERACAQRQIPLDLFSKAGRALDAWTVVDTVGNLFGLYRGASIAWVGNTGVGVHNVLEPLAWGVPVLFAPPFANSPDALELHRRKGAMVAEYDTSTTLLIILPMVKPRSEGLQLQLERGLEYYRESCEQQSQTQTELDTFLSSQIRNAP